MKKYRHIFFDLDHTLWDFEKNSTEALNELLVRHELESKGVPNLESFLLRFEEVNQKLWSDYNKNKINRDTIRTQRFLEILTSFSIHDKILINQLSDEYLMLCPTKPHVFPYAFDSLDYLKENYQLHILTNGFNDVQYIKLEKSKLLPYFSTVVTSDSSGYKKPMASIFKFAIDKAEANIWESIMVGDNLQADIIGAKNFGMDQIYFNPKEIKHNAKVTHEISCLSKLKAIF